MKSRILAILITILSATAYTSSKAENFRDSILNLITPQTDPLTKARYYCAIAKEDPNPDTVKYYANLSMEICGGDTLIRAEAYSYLGYIAYTEGAWEQSLQLYQHAYAIARLTSDSLLLAKIIFNTGCILESLNNIPEAMENFKQAISIFRKLKHTAWELWAYRQLCQVCTKSKMFYIAEKYCQEVMEVSRTTGDPYHKLISFISLAQMNSFKAETQQVDSIHRYLQRTLEACDSIQHIIDSTQCDNFDCMTLLNESYIEKFKAYTINSFYGRRFRRQAIDSAEKYILLADKWYHNTGDSVQLAMVDLCWAWLYYAKGDYNKALKASKNFKITNYTDKYIKEHLYNLLANTYYQLGQYKEAYQWQKKLNKFLNINTEEAKLAQVTERLLCNRLDEFDSAERMLKRENEALSSSVSNKQSQLLFAIIALCLSIFAIIVVCISVIRKRRVNKLLQINNLTLLQKQEEIIQQQGIITSQKEKVEQYNSMILQSIRYARHIQRMALPDAEEVKTLFPDYFLSYMPKDIVSGDFYYVTRCGDFRIVVIADCTGHGVPGGFLSMFGISAIKEILSRQNDNVMPGAVLDSMREFIKDAFSGDSETDETGDEMFSTADGMDMSVSAINLETREVRYAGAYHSAYIWSNGTISRLKGDRMPIGRHIKEDGPFTTIAQTLKAGDMLYMMTDGIQGQMGGLSGTKFMTKRLLQFFSENASNPVADQKERFETIIHDWMQNTMQVDDMTLMGIRIN
ncbi:MAG: SpoIIE family protein phosphatase [Bacteroidales bacterium]|nr:SpoIIE family protein phosphatase [Bacteroidales bacterium]